MAKCPYQPMTEFEQLFTPFRFTSYMDAAHAKLAGVNILDAEKMSFLAAKDRKSVNHVTQDTLAGFVVEFAACAKLNEALDLSYVNGKAVPKSQQIKNGWLADLFSQEDPLLIPVEVKARRTVLRSTDPENRRTGFRWRFTSNDEKMQDGYNKPCILVGCSAYSSQPGWMQIETIALWPGVLKGRDVAWPKDDYKKIDVDAARIPTAQFVTRRSQFFLV